MHLSDAKDHIQMRDSNPFCLPVIARGQAIQRCQSVLRSSKINPVFEKLVSVFLPTHIWCMQDLLCLLCHCKVLATRVYPKVFGLSHNEITKINARWEATQRVMEAKLTRLTHKIAIQLHLVAETCTICSSRSRRPVSKLFDTLSYCAKVLLRYLQRYWPPYLAFWATRQCLKEAHS
jgi:hypothetical protein